MDVRIAIITGSRIASNRDGSEPGRILQCMVTDPSDVQNVQTCQAGEEFNPPEGCTAVLVGGGSAYKIAAVVDDAIPPVMAKGGKRIYATDPTGAEVVAEMRLNPDGSIAVSNDAASITMGVDGAVTVSNGAASFTMSAGGTFSFHGVGTTFDHPVTVAGTLTAGEVIGGGKTLSTHTHGYLDGSTHRTTEAPT